MAQSSKTNSIITHFLNCSNSFSNDVNTRLKLFSTIKEFDTKLNKNIGLFVNLSNSRYKSVKSGNKLNTVIKSQKGKYGHLSQEIVTDDFYNNDDIRKEKDKIRQNIKSNAKAKMIGQIRNKIKVLTKDKQFDCYLNNKAKSPQHLAPDEVKSQVLDIEEGDINKDEGIKGDNNEEEDDDKDVNDEHNADLQAAINEKMDKAKRERIDHRKKKIKDNNDLIFDMVNNDNNIINDQFNEYRHYLNNIKEDLLTKNKDTLSLIDNVHKHHKTDPKSFFSFNRMKLLNFTSNKKKAFIKEKPLNLSIDLQKVFKYTKRGQRSKWRLNQLMTPMQINKTNETQTPDQTQSQRKPSLLLSYPNDKCNTVYKVKTEAKNLMEIETKMNKKRERVNRLFNDHTSPYLPWLSSYNNNNNNNESNGYKTSKSMSLYMSRFTNSQPNTKLKAKALSKSNEHSTNVNNNEEEGKVLIKKSIRSIYEIFEDVYCKKNKEWDNEEKERHKAKRPTLKELNTLHSFLDGINTLPRQTQYYIDAYSRKNKDNEVIKQFSKSLINSFYNKKSLNRLIKGYLIQKESQCLSHNDSKSFNKSEANSLIRNKTHLPLGFKFNLRNDEDKEAYNTTSANKPLERELGNSNGKSDYIPHYLRVQTIGKEERLNQEYEDLIKFRQYVEDKQLKVKEAKGTKSHKTIDVGLKLYNSSIKVNSTKHSNLWKRKSSWNRFNLSQESVLKMHINTNINNNNNGIGDNKSIRKNTDTYVSNAKAKGHIRISSSSNKNYVLNEFIIKKHA